MYRSSGKMSGIEKGQNHNAFVTQDTLFSNIQTISRSIPFAAKSHADWNSIHMDDYYPEGVIHG
jgi:hypothetical protein